MFDLTGLELALRPATESETSLFAQVAPGRDRVVDALMLGFFQNAFQRISWESEPAWDAVGDQIVFKVRHAGEPWLEVVQIEMYPHHCRVSVRNPQKASYEDWGQHWIYGSISWQTGLLLGQRFYEVEVRGLPEESFRGEDALMASRQITHLAQTATDFCLSTLPKPTPVKPQRKSFWRSLLSLGDAR